MSARRFGFGFAALVTLSATDGLLGPVLNSFAGLLHVLSETMGSPAADADDGEDPGDHEQKNETLNQCSVICLHRPAIEQENRVRAMGCNPTASESTRGDEVGASLMSTTPPANRAMETILSTSFAVFHRYCWLGQDGELQARGMDHVQGVTPKSVGLNTSPRTCKSRISCGAKPRI